MTIEAALVAHLQADVGLTAVVSTRIYPQLLPAQTTYPAVAYTFVSDVSEHAMGSDPGPRVARLQTTSWDLSYRQARVVAGLVETALSRFRQASGPQVFDVLKDNKLDTYDPTVRAHGVVVDFRVFYSEA